MFRCEAKILQLLATRIFHLAMEKKIQSPLGARIKNLISDPAVNDVTPVYAAIAMMALWAILCVN